MSASRHPACRRLTLSVVICTYKRPDALLPCLDGLARQTRLPDDVILVVRTDDTQTRAALWRTPPAGPLAWRIASVTAPGLVAARNVGLAACHTDIVAFCDDDTLASPGWAECLLARFAADDKVGGVGGRDRCHDGTGFDERRRRVVGRLQWFGRSIGNHHLGCGGLRRVHFLKGANMSFRMVATRGIRFDERLRGAGAQPHDDLAFSLAVARAGWRLVYDPQVQLDHYAATRDQARSYVAQAGLADPDGFYDAAYNLQLALRLNLSGPRLWMWRIWSLLVGARAYPGVVQALRLTVSEGAVAWRKFALCVKAASAATHTLRGRSLRMALREQRSG